MPLSELLLPIVTHFSCFGVDFLESLVSINTQAYSQLYATLCNHRRAANITFILQFVVRNVGYITISYQQFFPDSPQGSRSDENQEFTTRVRERPPCRSPTSAPTWVGVSGHYGPIGQYVIPLQLVRYLISTITAFSKPVLKRICSHQHQSKFN